MPHGEHLIQGAAASTRAFQVAHEHTIRTQSPDGLHGTVVTGLRRWTQWDDMPDLKATVAHDDALDDKLQDGLLVGKGCPVQARVDAIAERRQVHPHGFGPQPLLA